MDLKQVVDKLISAADSFDFPVWEQRIVQTLSNEVEHYSWVGFYWVRGEMLHLGAWDGPEATEHVEIPIGDGICGLAARTLETVIVDDVHARSEYLACFPQTRSEIVVPVLRDGRAIGEIDIDSDHAAAFSDEDRRELERLAEVVAQHYPSHNPA